MVATREDEIVLSPDGAKTEKEMKEILKHNAQAKENYSRRREEEWINQPGLMDRFAAGIAKVKAMFGKKQARAIAQAKKEQSR